MNSASSEPLCQPLSQTKNKPLSNPIHPLLAPEQWPSSINYPSLKPSLRLTSHFLELDDVVRHIHTMCFGELYVHTGNARMKVDFEALDAMRDERGMNLQTKVSRYPVPGTLWVTAGNAMMKVESAEVDDLRAQNTHLTVSRLPPSLPTMRKQVQTLLLRARDLISFTLTTDKTVAGRTAIYPGPLKKPQAKHFPRGTRSVIEINETHYLNLRSSDAETQLAAQFEIATTILHELGHALQLCVTGNRPIELFHASSSVSEAGYALQSAAFGGNLLSTTTGLLQSCTEVPQYVSKHFDKRIYVLKRWPNAVLEELYLKKGARIGFRSFNARRTASVGRVPRSFVEGLLTESFWVEQRLKGEVWRQTVRVPFWAGTWEVVFDGEGEGGMRAVLKRE